MGSYPLSKNKNSWQITWSNKIQSLELIRTTQKEILWMSNGREFEKPCMYHLKVKGKLDAEWSGWFEGFTISSQPDDETAITGQIEDQSALHGLLGRIASLGLSLISVTRLEDSYGDHKMIKREKGE